MHRRESIRKRFLRSKTRTRRRRVKETVILNNAGCHRSSLGLASRLRSQVRSPLSLPFLGPSIRWSQRRLSMPFVPCSLIRSLLSLLSLSLSLSLLLSLPLPPASRFGTPLGLDCLALSSPLFSLPFFPLLVRLACLAGNGRSCSQSLSCILRVPLCRGSCRFHVGFLHLRFESLRHRGRPSFSFWLRFRS
jgi:hypothetical protein